MAICERLLSNFVIKSFMIMVLITMSACESDTIKFKIVSNEGETKFEVPRHMIDKCCRPKTETPGFVLVDLDNKKHGGNDFYHITLRTNNNDSMLKITLPSMVADAEEVPSKFPGYKQYVQHKDQNMPFLLVGKDAAGKAIYLECVAQANPNKKCIYYGIFDNKLSYEFMFPKKQLGDIESLITFARQHINKLIVKEVE